MVSNDLVASSDAARPNAASSAATTDVWRFSAAFSREAAMNDASTCRSELRPRVTASATSATGTAARRVIGFEAAHLDHERMRRRESPDVALHGTQPAGFLEAFDQGGLQHAGDVVGPAGVGDIVEATARPAARDAFAVEPGRRALDDDREVGVQRLARPDIGRVHAVDARRRHLVLQPAEAAGCERRGGGHHHVSHGGISTPAGAGP